MTELSGTPYGRRPGFPAPERAPAARRLKRTIARIVIPGAAVAGLFAAVAVWAFFTTNGAGTGTATVGSFGAPLVVPAGAPDLSKTHMVPGDISEQPATVTNVSAGNARISVYAENVTGSLASSLELSVVEDGTDVLYDGPLGGAPSPDSPLSLPGSGAGGVWAQGESHTFVFTVTFPKSAGNAYQSTNASLDFVWKEDSP